MSRNIRYRSRLSRDIIKGTLFSVKKTGYFIFYFSMIFLEYFEKFLENFKY